MGPSTPMKERGADINTASFPGVQYVGWTNTFSRDDTAITSASLWCFYIGMKDVLFFYQFMCVLCLIIKKKVVVKKNTISPGNVGLVVVA